MNATKPLLICWSLALLILASCGDPSETPKTPATSDGATKASGSAAASPTPSGAVSGTKPTQSTVAMPEGGVGVASNGALRVVPQRFELGNIDPGSSHPRTFTLENVSAGPLTITRAATSCKCTTTTDVANRVLSPGESIDFEVNLDAPETPGLKEAKVQLLLEGGLPPVLLTLSGDVTMAIKSSPPYVGGAKGDESSGVVELQSNDGQPFTILSAGGIVPPVGGDGGSEPSSKHTLRWNLADGPDLSTHLWWVVYTDHPDCPVLPLRIRNPMTGSRADMARYDRFWMFEENVVNAGRIKAGESVDLDVVIAHYNPRGRGAVVNPLWRNVKSVRSLTPKAHAKMVSVTPISQDEVRVQFSFMAEAGTSGPLYAFVEVETDTGTGRFAVLALVD